MFKYNIKMVKKYLSAKYEEHIKEVNIKEVNIKNEYDKKLITTIYKTDVINKINDKKDVVK